MSFTVETGRRKLDKYIQDLLVSNPELPFHYNDEISMVTDLRRSFNKQQKIKKREKIKKRRK